ncbi:MAG: WecB/TagA/CpsF family glycosyltransferase [Candidatus Eremiobacteraeota bacterium]|nr:WecB/TagA/CpsF family glycosyltransferase [Candidatus Eremiobacteraeota bacterium]
MDTIHILGTKVHNLSMDETLDEIDNLIQSGGAHLIVTLGVEMVMHAQKDAEFREIVNNASLVVPDSVGILWAGKKSGVKLKGRAPGIDIINRMTGEAKKYPWRVFLLGAKPGVTDKASRIIKEKHPDFNCVGTYHGYFKDDDEAIEQIKKANPQLLLIGMGFPAQEKWFHRNRDKLGDMVAIGVGGSFDVLSGNIKRAPAFFQKTGLEWFYRLITQPSRFHRMTAIPAFVIKVLFSGNSNRGIG